MDEKQAVQEIVTAITPELWYMFFQMVLAAILTLALVQMLKSLVAYLFVRFDRELGKNVKVVMDGEEGYVAHINLQHLIVRMKSGNEKLVPITKVRTMVWEVVRLNGDFQKKKEVVDE